MIEHSTFNESNHSADSFWDLLDHGYDQETANSILQNWGLPEYLPNKNEILTYYQYALEKKLDTFLADSYLKTVSSLDRLKDDLDEIMRLQTLITQLETEITASEEVAT